MFSSAAEQKLNKKPGLLSKKYELDNCGEILTGINEHDYGPILNLHALFSELLIVVWCLVISRKVLLGVAMESILESSINWVWRRVLGKVVSRPG